MYCILYTHNIATLNCMVQSEPNSGLCSIALYILGQCTAVQYSAVNTVQCSAEKCTVEHSVQYCPTVDLADSPRLTDSQNSRNCATFSGAGLMLYFYQVILPVLITEDFPCGKDCGKTTSALISPFSNMCSSPKQSFPRRKNWAENSFSLE